MSTRSKSRMLVLWAVAPTAASLLLTTVISASVEDLGCSPDIKKDAFYYGFAVLYYVGPIASGILVAWAYLADHPHAPVWRYPIAVFAAICTLAAAALVSIPVLFVQAALQGCYQ